MISTIPFIMLILGLLQFIIPQNEDLYIRLIKEYLPDMFQNFVLIIVDELIKKTHTAVFSASVITIFWSSARGMRGIISGIRNIYKTSDRVKFIRNIIYSFIVTFFFIIFMTVVLILVIFGRYIADYLLTVWNLPFSINWSFIIMRYFFTVIILILIFMAVYRSLSPKNMKLRTHFPGALLASLGWVVFSFGYSLYIDNFADYSYIYGSLAAVVLLMIWIYMCMTILLCGAEFNLYIYDKKTLGLNAPE